MSPEPVKPTSELPPDPIRTYITSQGGRFTTNGNNHFASGFRSILRYEKFLVLILQRHMPVAEALKARMMNGTEVVIGTPPPFMDMEFLERQQLSDLAHLDIESFYTFAKVLLDWTARLVEFHFGQAQKSTLDSHDKITKHLQKYANEKGLTPAPEPLLTAMRELKREIADYRDYQIAHGKNFRAVQGTSVSSSGPIMSIAYVAPISGKEDLEIRSKPLLDLTKQVLDYLGLVTAYLTENQEKAVFERRPKA